MKNIQKILGVLLLITLFYSCKEKPTPPVLSTTAATAISYTTATSGGEVTNEGGDPVISRGICWNTSADPTISNSKTSESGGLGTFTSNITSLTPNTTYYVRAYGTNTAGTGYGDSKTFITLQVAVPVLTTTAITAITQTSAVSGGNINDDKGGAVSARGVCWGTATNPTTANSKTTDGTGTGIFVSNLTGLQAITVYYVRSFATNSVGTSYGTEVSFTTLATVPDAPTIGITTAGNAQATVAFTAPASNGGSAITGYTVTSNPGNITGTGATNPITVSGLTNGIAYTFTVTATNAIGNSAASSASNSVIPTLPTVTDIDGNVYNIVTIGTQVWMAENLKTTKYNDNTAIPLVTDNTAWSSPTPHYCWYNNDVATYKATNGALYNWYTVSTGNLCPTGWHVPTDVEWTTLTTYLGGLGVAGGKLKETGIAHWTSPNTGATNETGFTALPGGFRHSSGAFDNIGYYGYWWSITEYNASSAWDRNMYLGTSVVYRYYDHKEAGFSVRCLKDN